jgi:hypothetical protein
VKNLSGRIILPDLTILTVNYHTSDFIDNMLYCLQRTTFYPYHVLIADNFYSNEEKIKVKQICRPYDNAEIFFRKQSQFGSLGHGEALDVLTEKVNTPFFAILDADATFLKHNWDKILISELDSECKVIGTQSQLFQNKKHTNFPFMFAILFETHTFKGLDIQFKPSSQDEALKGKDTGHQLRGKYKAANKIGKLLYHKYSINRKKSPFYKIACAEYYLPGCDKIFASHFWRGSSLVMSENISLDNRLIHLLRQIPRIGGRVITKIRKRQKARWLKICKEIVNNETDKKM